MMARLTSGVAGGMKAITRCKPAALLNRALGSDAAAPPRAPPVASCQPAGTVSENPSKASLYTELEDDEAVVVGAVRISSAAKEGRASRAAVAAARLPRAMRREDDGSGAVDTTALPADRKLMQFLHCTAVFLE